MLAHDIPEKAGADKENYAGLCVLSWEVCRPWHQACGTRDRDVLGFLAKEARSDSLPNGHLRRLPDRAQAPLNPRGSPATDAPGCRWRPAENCFEVPHHANSSSTAFVPFSMIGIGRPVLDMF